ncbi:MptD family putative ECF transporter S component [Ruminococcus sp.]|uniref:MptD family putative ECF transporter S component n=1 Tax=Ruminococcus sp. TaxID=41978 RepID=UPI002601132C|nr:MptD family putative ECF transporter S component [Ruminococcus sp.]MBQ8966734.1 MptD family putative ECF transporter S component [Ruminococcus sp.]
MKSKDLINIGIFSAIYFAIVFVVAMLGFIPIFLLLLSVLVPLLGGIPFMLFLTKVDKFGMIWIMSVIMGLLMLLTGMSWPPLAVSAVTGLIADLVYKSGKYKSAAKAVITHGIFSLWVGANYLPLFMNAEKYWSTRQNFGKDYIDTVTKLTPSWMCPVLFLAAFVFGIIGGLVGRKLMKKHFEKAGIV